MTVFTIGEHTIEETRIENVAQYVMDDMRIYQIRVESMPGFLTNVYLIVDREITLVDVGSHAPKAQADLYQGFAITRQAFNEQISLDDIQNIVVTHGHGDHFTMLLDREELQGKRVYAHPLDIPSIEGYVHHYDQWHTLMGKLAQESGLSYVPAKDEFFSPQHINFNPEGLHLLNAVDKQELINGYQVYHTPGHSAGHICLQVGPVLFLGDHMLSSTTPHQTPRQSNGGYGLSDYLDSLKKVADLEPLLGLAGHEKTILEVNERAHEIEAFHQQRLEELEELCQQEHTLYQLTDAYYQRYPQLIGGAASISGMEDMIKVGAMEEIKAHVEYLTDRQRMTETIRPDGILAYRTT